jgi:hypothetical protein
LKPIPLPEHAQARVVLHGDNVLISNLVVNGLVAQLVSRALAEGKDPETIVCQAVEIGAAVLLQGADKGTVDAVASEVERVLAALRNEAERLQEKSSRLEVVQRLDERSNAGGYRFEDSIGPFLEVCFAPFGDEVEFTGKTRGIANSIVGDYEVRINPDEAGGDRRIVFEAKSHKKPPTVKDALAELDRAMENRVAQVGVFVCPKSKSPLKGRHLRLYHGNRILVTWDPEGEDGSELALEVATQLARALAIAAGGYDFTLDDRVLADRLAELQFIIERSGAIGRGLSTIRRGLKDADEAYKEMRAEALAIVWGLRDLLGEEE